MINAPGLLEADGMATTVDVADAIPKATNVRLLNHEVFDPDRLTLVVEDGLAAYRAALDAGSAAAARTGRVISCREIGRPDGDTQRLIGGFKRQPKRPGQKPEAKTEVKPGETQGALATFESSTQLLTLLASVHQGITAGEVTAHFGWSPDETRNALGQLFSDGALCRRSSRYRLESQLIGGPEASLKFPT